MAKKTTSRSTTSGFAAKASSAHPWLKLGLLALAITAACYLPTLRHDFVNWDDPANITENPNLKLLGNGQGWGTTLANIFDLEKGSVIGNYNPLPILTFAMEKTLAGGEFNPGLTHFVNLLLHLLTVFMVMKLLWGMGIGRWGVFTGGLLFGIHPMRVESVAWATERKDVLFALFFFMALSYYLKWLKQAETGENRTRTYGIMLFLALLSCLSKVQAVALPLSMLALDFWMRRLDINLKFVLNAALTALTGGLIFLVLPRTPDREPFREKIPFFLLSFLFGGLNLYTLQAQGSTNDAVLNFSFLDQLCLGAYTFCTYLYKLFFPFPMSPLYSYPKVLPWTVYAAPLGFGLVLAGFIWALRQDQRRLAFGLLFFTFNVMFVLQIFAAGQGFLADRFTYVAYFGLFVLAAAYLDDFSKTTDALPKVYAILGSLALVYSAWTINQVSIWKDGTTLWTHVMAQNEGSQEHSLLPYFNRAQILSKSGDYEAALKDYSRALEIDPSNYELLIMRGKTYFKMASSDTYRKHPKPLLDKAIQDFSDAISKSKIPAKAKSDALINRGAAFGLAEQYEQCINDLTEGLQLDPGNKKAYENRSFAYINLGQYEKALNDYQSILKIDPNDADFWYESALILRSFKRFEDAKTALDNAIRLNPKLALAYLERGRVMASLGNRSAAEQDYQKAVRMGVSLQPLDQQLMEAAK